MGTHGCMSPHFAFQKGQKPRTRAERWPGGSSPFLDRNVLPVSGKEGNALTPSGMRERAAGEGGKKREEEGRRLDFGKDADGVEDTFRCSEVSMSDCV